MFSTVQKLDYASLHGGTRVFQVAILMLTMRCFVQGYNECFYQSISWKSMRAVDEKQDIKLLWPNKRRTNSGDEINSSRGV